MTRLLAMTLRSDFFDPQAAVDPSAYQLLPMQITTAVEITSLSIDDEGWHLVWKDLIGDHLRNYSSKLPAGALDRIAGDEVVEIEYLVRPNGEVLLETPQEQIVEQYASMNRLAAGEGSLFDEFAAEVVVASTGFAVLFPDRAPALLTRIIETYHQGHGLTMEPGDLEVESRWGTPFASEPVPIPTALTVTERQSPFGCLSVDAVGLVEPGSPAAGSLASVIGAPTGGAGIEWALTSTSLRDISTGVVYRSELRFRAEADDGRMVLQSIALVDDAFIQWNFGPRD